MAIARAVVAQPDIGQADIGLDRGFDGNNFRTALFGGHKGPGRPGNRARVDGLTPPVDDQIAVAVVRAREITDGAYGATGYEIVAYYSDPITPERALQIWQQSDGHHIMIVNRGQWADNTWRAMGAAMGEHYAVVWFGEEPDTAAK